MELVKEAARQINFENPQEETKKITVTVKGENLKKLKTIAAFYGMEGNIKDQMSFVANSSIESLWGVFLENNKK